jgi:hypothetical protein
MRGLAASLVLAGTLQVPRRRRVRIFRRLGLLFRGVL